MQQTYYKYILIGLKCNPKALVFIEYPNKINWMLI
jgi:hypothetical protein